VTIVSILRLKYMIQFAQTSNVTWDYLPIGYWSAIEAHVGAIVACAPAIRQLQRSIRERFWPKQKTPSQYYYAENSGNSSKKNNGSKDLKSRIWLPKTDRSQLSTLGRSKMDKEDFVRLDEYEMGVGTGGKNGVLSDRNSPQNSSEGSLDRSFKSNEDVQPLADTAAPAPVVGSPLGGIMVQSEYSVDRGSSHPSLQALPPIQHKKQRSMDTSRWL
jgi:hypothetical protein